MNFRTMPVATGVAGFMLYNYLPNAVMLGTV
jgi:hypothetical protein